MSENNIPQNTISISDLVWQSFFIAIATGRYFTNGKVFLITLAVLLAVVILSKFVNRLFVCLSVIFSILWACVGFGIASLFFDNIAIILVASFFAFCLGCGINMIDRTQFKNVHINVAMEIFIIAILAGIATESLEFFGIILVLFSVLVFIVFPFSKFPKFWAFIFALFWAIIARAIAESYFESKLVIFSLSILAFFIGFCFNYTEIENKENKETETQKTEEPKPNE